MSVSAIMKNVLSFAEILSQSGGRSAQHWDKQSLQNAVKWAKYCEQIYYQAVRKGFGEDLDKQVQSLVIYLRPATCMELTINTLKYATITLRKNLLQNPFISDEMFEEVMKLYGTPDHPLPTFKQECSDIVYHRETNEILQAIVQPLSGSREINSLCMCQGEQLMSALVEHITMNPNHKSRFQDYLNQLLKQLTNEELGWDILGCSLLCDIEGFLSESEHIRQLILTWLRQTNHRSAPRMDRNLLYRLSENNADFHQLYLDSLINWGEQMCVKYNSPGTQPLYTWRSRNKNKTESLESFLLHWTGLLSNSHVGKMSREKLLELSLRDEPNVFRDIRKSIGQPRENET